MDKPPAAPAFPPLSASGGGTDGGERIRYGRYFFQIALLLVVLLAYQVHVSYKLDYRNAEAEVANLALVLESKIGDALQSAEYTADEMASGFDRQVLREAASRELGVAAIARLQHALIHNHDGLTLRYFNAEGRELPGPEAGGNQLDIAGLRYFNVLRTDASAVMTFSEVMTEPESGKKQVYLAKPIRDEDGAFLGVVQAGIDLDAIRKLVDQVDVGATDVVAMRRLDDGAIVFRRPGYTEVDNQPMPDCPIVQAVRRGAPSGISEYICKPGEPVRLVGYRTVAGYPFVVYVGLDKRNFLAGWHEDVMVATAATALVLLIIGLIFRRLAHSEARRLAAEAQLRENEKRFHDIVVASGDWVWEVDAAGRYTYVSDGVRDLLGYEPDVVLGRTPFDFMPPDEARRVGAAFAAVAAQRRPFRDLDNINVHKDGSLRHVETSGMPILDGDGGLLGYRGLDKDVSARVEAERALQKSRATLSALFQSTPAGIVVTRQSDGRLVDVNETFLAMYGAKREEVIGKNTLELNAWDHPELRSKLIGLVLGHGIVRDFEVVLHNKTGKARTGSISAALVDLGGEKHIVGVIFDITERKRLETELKQSKDRLISALTVELERRAIAAEAATHAKSQFLANMSHEFRTPLNAIMGFSQILQRRVMSPEEKDMLVKIIEASKRMLAMLNDVLSMSRLENGKLVVKEVEFDADALISAVAEEGVQKTAAKHLGFNLEVEVLPRSLCGDPDRLKVILDNYLDNAVKFTETGAVTLRGRVIKAGAHDMLLRFEVQDTGIGVPADKQARIFEPFEQADNSMTRHHGGTGLGLAINQRLARLLGGEVGMESNPGHGSLFWVTARFRKGESPHVPERS